MHHHRQQILKSVAIGGIGQTLDKIDDGVEGGDLDVGVLGGTEALEEDAVELLDVGGQRVADVLGELGEDEEGGLLELGDVGGDALEHEGEELGPAVVREDAGGELGDGVAELLGDGLGLLALNRGEEDGLEGGLGLRGEAGVDVGVVAGEELAEEDGGHGAELQAGAVVEDVGQLQGEGVGIRLLRQVEQRLRLGSELVGGGHEVRD